MTSSRKIKCVIIFITINFLGKSGNVPLAVLAQGNPSTAQTANSFCAHVQSN